MNDQEIVDEIQRIRANNNKVWMDLVRLAIRVAPQESKKIFSEITSNDEKVSELLRKLSNDRDR